jgi:hypothetical protein
VNYDDAATAFIDLSHKNRNWACFVIRSGRPICAERSFDARSVDGYDRKMKLRVAAQQELSNLTIFPLAKVVSAVWVIAFLASCGFFPEASFNLALESRIPRWFSLDPSTHRGDVQVEMSYYISSAGRTAKFTLKRKGDQFSNSVSCTERGLEPVYFGPSSTKPADQYPSYEVITCNGIPT